jgi:hypothetical protein
MYDIKAGDVWGEKPVMGWSGATSVAKFQERDFKPSGFRIRLGAQYTANSSAAYVSNPTGLSTTKHGDFISMG